MAINREKYSPSYSSCKFDERIEISRKKGAETEGGYPVLLNLSLRETVNKVDRRRSATKFRSLSAIFPALSAPTFARLRFRN